MNRFTIISTTTSNNQHFTSQSGEMTLENVNAVLGRKPFKIIEISVCSAEASEWVKCIIVTRGVKLSKKFLCPCSTNITQQEEVSHPLPQIDHNCNFEIFLSSLERERQLVSDKKGALNLTLQWERKTYLELDSACCFLSIPVASPKTTMAADC